MEIKVRIRYFRKDIKKLTQDEFRKAINLSRSNLASIETGAVNITDRVIADICKTFNISEHWLRNGEGDMYIESDASLVDSLAKQMNMSAEQKKLMEIFLSMSDEKRDSISRAFFDFLEAARHLDAAPPAEKRVSDAERAELHRLLDEEIDAEEKARSVSKDGSIAKRA